MEITETTVCPRAIYTPEMRVLTSLLSDMQQIPNATPYGAILAQWPAKFADIWGAYQSYLKAEENAVQRAVNRS